MESKEKNLLIIVGPTGVGKSVVAIRLAKQYSGEVISCDSMQVYRGFDIGTDKIPQEKQENIPHHLLDILNSSDQFTAAEFAHRAADTIRLIHERNKLPIIAGGTGLYIKALIEGLFPEDTKDPLIRKELEGEADEKGLEVLWERLRRIDPEYGEHVGRNDRIRIIRALEVYTATGKPISDHFLSTKPYVHDFNITQIGLKLERKELYNRIEDRVEKMYEQGIVDEVRALFESGVKESAPPFRALGYKHVLQFLKEEISLDEAIYLTKRDTRHYAKRQMTWFRKREGIRWLDPHDFSKISEYVAKRLG
ncbi:tRNA (adenosine(37)-N6)-dimethylallyltransferase MiaA [Acidobacteriota bacterium]